MEDWAVLELFWNSWAVLGLIVFSFKKDVSTQTWLLRVHSTGFVFSVLTDAFLPFFLNKTSQNNQFQKTTFFYRSSFPSDANSSSLFCTFRANSTPKRLVADFMYPSTIPLSTSFARKAFAHALFEVSRISGHVFAWWPSTWHTGHLCRFLVFEGFFPLFRCWTWNLWIMSVLLVGLGSPTREDVLCVKRPIVFNRDGSQIDSIISTPLVVCWSLFLSRVTHRFRRVLATSSLPGMNVANRLNWLRKNV